MHTVLTRFYHVKGVIMAKVFKIIMNIILVIFIAALCAVFIPPILGITTAVAAPGTESNMQTGSIAYGVRESLDDLNAGDDIIVTSGDSTYLYEVVEVDSSNGELTVKTSEDAETEIIQLRRTASRAVIVIPLLGYVLIATQSFTGLIILALAAALIIILSIIASVLKKQAYDDDAEDDEDEENEHASDYHYFKDLAASTSRPNRLDKLGTMTIPTITDEDIQKSQEKFADTGSLNEQIEEISELILEPSDGKSEKVPEETINLEIPEPLSDEGVQEAANVSEPAETESPGTSKETENADKSEAAYKAVTADKTKDVQESEKAAEPAAEARPDSEFSSLEDALENALNSEQIKNSEHAQAASQKTGEDVSSSQPETEAADASSETEKEIPSEVELAIPIRTLDELLQEAYANGEDPQVRKDPSTGITLVDYSSSF